MSVSWLFQAVEAQQLRHIRLGRKILFDVKELGKLIEKKMVGVKDWSEILERKVK